MKKTLMIVLGIIMLSPVAFASDFSKNLYCVSREFVSSNVY